MCSGHRLCHRQRPRGDSTRSFPVTWALVRAHFFLDKSELRVGSVDRRMKQETGGAGKETDVGLHESL